WIHANSPTYMMVDDHEITDDWNLDFAWGKPKTPNRRFSPITAERQPKVAIEPTSAVIANGMLAFMAFQFFGAPWAEDIVEATIANLWRESSTNARPGSDFVVATAIMKAAIERMRVLTHQTAHHYTVGLVDSRTDRQFTTSGRNIRTGQGFSIEYRKDGVLQLPWDGKVVDRPILLGPETQRRLQRILASKKAETAMLTLATPLFGYPLIEEYQNNPLHDPIEYDRENWFTNPLSFSTFVGILGRTSTLKEVILLAGDVHYSFGVSGSFYFYGGEEKRNPRMLSFAQLTSSPVRNRLTGKRRVVALGGPLALNTNTGFLWWQSWDALREVMVIDRVSLLPVPSNEVFRRTRARHGGRYAEFSVSYSLGGNSAILAS